MWQPQGFYNEYSLRTPVIISGEESVRGLFDYPSSRIAVIHGRSFFDKDLFESAFSRKDIRFIKRSWDGEPDNENIAGTLHELEEYQPDLIIAVGGGSVIDGVKLCRLYYEFPYYRPGETRISGEMMRTGFIAVPTTIGSGSEVSSAAVYIDHENHRKDMIVIHELQAGVVVYDPRYVSGTPDRILVASALDAMAHILEGYVSNRTNEWMDILAEKGLTLLISELKCLLNGKKEEIDFQRLQYAGYIGGLVQNHCIVGAAHAVAHQLSEYGYSHGEAVALLLPLVIMNNRKDDSTRVRYEQLAERSDCGSVQELVDSVSELCDKTGIGERRDDLRKLMQELFEKVEFINNVKNDKGGAGNPVKITNEYIESLIRSI